MRLVPNQSANVNWPTGLVPALAILLGTFLVYYPSWHGAFIWDDESHIVNNPVLVEPDGLIKIWTSSESLQYYPLVFTSFRLERALWGLNPTGFHLDNLLLHAASALLLWRLLARLNIPGAWLAGAVFAVHPVNVESVAWISQRKNTLAMFFYLLSFLWYVRSEEEPEVQSPEAEVQSPRSKVQGHQSARVSSFTFHASCITHQASRFTPRTWYRLSVSAFVLALLSKTAVSPFPLVLLGFCWWRRGTISRKDALPTVPYFAASLILGLITIWFERHRNEIFDAVRSDGFLSRFASAGWAVWFYLSKVLAPFRLTPVYSRWQIDPAQLLAYLPGLLLITGLIMLWLYRERMGRSWVFCAGYYVLMLLPVLGFVNVGFMAYSFVADHWQYFAIIAPIVGGVALFASSSGTGVRPSSGAATFGKGQHDRVFRLPKVFGRCCARAGGTPALSVVSRHSLLNLCIAVIVILGLAALTWRQSRLYANSEGFWRGSIAVNPDCPAAHLSLGVILLRKGALDEASTEFQQALRLKPDYAEAHLSLGQILAQKGSLDAAIEQYEKALKRMPYNAAVHFSLAAVFLQKGRMDDVINEYQAALRFRNDPQFARYNPGVPLTRDARFFADAHYNLANALLKKNRFAEAIAQYQQALRYEPGDVDTHRNLGVAFVFDGKLDDAVGQFQEAVRLDPTLADAHYQLGDAYARKGDLKKAVEQFKSALSLKPDHTQARRALDAAERGL